VQPAKRETLLGFGQLQHLGGHGLGAIGAPGDTVVVQVKVTEGDKSRLQAYEGVVIAIKNRGLNSAFTVRKISSGVGVERVFQTHSPIVDSITVKRRGDVRQAKLYYLRELSGRKARIKEKLAKK